MAPDRIIITIDGPAGSGKSTVASQLAGRLGVAYLDTGAMYRAVTLAALERGVQLDDGNALERLVSECRLEIGGQGQEGRVWLDGRDVTNQIRNREVTEQAHKLANEPGVREQLVRQQQRIGEQVGSLVTEGRDQGTVVFPDASYKFYLEANAECRARRRWEQLRGEAVDVSYDDILSSQLKRDKRDAGRSVGPMKAAADAIVVDTTDMSVEQVVQRLYEMVK